MDIKEDIRMRLAVALMFTIVCYAGDCLASTPNVVTDQGRQSSTVKQEKSTQGKSKQGKSKQGKSNNKQKQGTKAGKHGS